MSVVVFSGGLDSTVLLTDARRQGKATALSFDYGQRHVKELDHARRIAATLGVPHHVIDLRHVGTLLTGSALTDDTVAVPDGHYAEATMAATVVPNRNAILLSVAAGYAVAHGEHEVWFAAHTGDHFVYPDCRPVFVDVLDSALRLGNDPAELHVHAPYAGLTKADIVALGADLGAPLELSWSCYRGDDLHCGTCGTCVERREAFTVADVSDPTTYGAAVRR